jgi:hypothetical protein
MKKLMSLLPIVFISLSSMAYAGDTGLLVSENNIPTTISKTTSIDHTTSTRTNGLQEDPMIQDNQQAQATDIGLNHNHLLKRTPVPNTNGKCYVDTTMNHDTHRENTSQKCD